MYGSQEEVDRVMARRKAREEAFAERCKNAPQPQLAAEVVVLRETLGDATYWSHVENKEKYSATLSALKMTDADIDKYIEEHNPLEV
jgi:hypothetical protein